MPFTWPAVPANLWGKVQASTSNPLELAAHYRLIDPALLDAEEERGPDTLLAELERDGTLDEATRAFLEQKSAWLEVPTVSTRGFLAQAVRSGYLTEQAVDELVGFSSREDAEADYEAAVWCQALGLLTLWQIVDLLERSERALFDCAGCRTAYYPATLESLPDAPACPDCSRPTRLLTHLPRLGLAAPPLPNIPQLRIQPLARQADDGPAAHVLRVARHYRLISDEQATLVAEGPDDVTGMSRLLLEEGLLTTTEFKFLTGRAEQTLAEGWGVTGSDLGADLMTLASSLGYVTQAVRERLASHPLFAQRPDEAKALREREVAWVQLLFNLGTLRFYQTIDLLERKGLMLDHCGACQAQWLDDGEADGRCPDCRGELVRMTGWTTTEELSRPIPRSRRLTIRRHVPLVTEPDGTPALGGMESSLMLPALDDEELAEEPDDGQVRWLLERYRLLAPDQLSRAFELAEESQGPLLGVLVSMGFLRPSAIGFLRRRLGLAPVVEEADPLGLAIRHGYLSPRILPEGVSSKELPAAIAMTLIGEAYNRGQLKYYQLLDLVESANVRLEHCPDCLVQLVCEPDRTIPLDCPACRSTLLPFHLPGGIPEEQALPHPDRLDICNYAAFGLSTDTLAESRRMVSAVGLDAIDAATDENADLLVDSLIRRYGLMSEEALALAGELPRGPDEITLEERLFREGYLRADALGFLAQMRQELLSGDSALGDLADHRLTDIAQAKGYLTLLRYHKLFRLPDAPAPEADEMAIAGFLHARGALALFQLIHVLEAKGVALMHCAPCGLQYRVTGRIDVTRDYLCPDCMERLLPLTALPGAGRRFEVLPEIPALQIRTVTAGELQATQVSRRLALPGEIQVPDLQAPPLQQITLDEASAESWASQAARTRRVLELHKKQRHALDSFYEEELLEPPPQALQTTRLRPISSGPATALRRAVPLDATGRLQQGGQETELLVREGITLLRRLGMAMLLLLAVGLGLGVYFSRGRGEEKPPEPVAPSRPRTTQRATFFGKLVPGSMEDGERPQFMLAVDLDSHYWVVCESAEARKQYKLLAALLASGKRDPVLLQVEGRLERNPHGADETPSGKRAYHVAAIRLKRVFELPKERIRKD